MTIASAFRWIVLVQVASSGLALLVAGAETAASGMAMMALILLAAIARGPWPRSMKLRKRFWNVLAVLVLLLFLTELAFTRQLLPPVVRLVVFLTGYKLFNLITNRDYFALFMLSFLQLLAAASISYDYRFALPFLLFVGSSCLSLMLYSVKAGMERELFTRSLITGCPAPASSPRLRPRRLPGALAVTLAVLLLTAFLFPVLPRVRTDVLGASADEPLLRLSGFSTIVDLDAISDIKLSERIVMRVTLSGEEALLQRQPKLRGIALSHFDGRRWYHSMRGATRLRRWRDGRFHLDEPPPGPTLTQEIILNPIDSRVLFVAGHPESLRGPFRSVVTDRTGSIFMDRPIYGQVRYSVSALVPSLAPDDSASSQPEPSGIELRILSALPENSSLTFNDRRRIEQLTERVIADADNSYLAMKRIERYLQQNYEYTLNLSQYQGERSKLMSFIFDRREGHCEYFASAMVVMARSVGLPARLVNGFQLGQYNPFGGFYTVRAADAHSWAEVYLPGRGWFEFDPTPASGQRSTFSRASPDLFSGLLESLDMFWLQNVLAYDAISQQQFVESIRQGVGTAFNLLDRAIDNLLALIPNISPDAEIYPYLRFLVEIIIAAVILWILHLMLLRPFLRWLRRCRDGTNRKPVAFLEKTLKLLRRSGHELFPEQTTRELVAAVADRSYGPVVAEIVGIYEFIRFGGDKAAESKEIENGWSKLRELKKMVSTENSS